MAAAGSLSVLNVGAGDIQIVFNKHDPDERVKAIRMLTDMVRRGYAILVRLDDGTYLRAKEIDAETGCYVVQLPDAAPAVELKPEVQAAEGGPHRCACGCGQEVADGKTWVRGHHNRNRRGKRLRVPIERAYATAIARSAGG